MRKNINDTTGLKCPPEILPINKIATPSAKPILIHAYDLSAIVNDTPSTVTIITPKKINVPINSAKNLFNIILI